jgi:hypothetical protein
MARAADGISISVRSRRWGVELVHDVSQLLGFGRAGLRSPRRPEGSGNRMTCVALIIPAGAENLAEKRLRI